MKLCSRQLWLATLVWVTTACSSSVQALLPIVTPAPLPLPTATATSAPTLTPAPPIPTPSLLPVCLETRGTITAASMDSAVLGEPMAMQVYLPPCYTADETRSYPVLYLLHGLKMNEKSWAELGAADTADSLIAARNIPPLIIVMPYDREDEDFGEAIITELLLHVDNHYRTIPKRSYRALGGMSYGAGWVVDVGFQHPELFGALGMHSLAIFYRDEGKVSRWLDKIPADLRPRIYIDIGQGDKLIVSASWLDEALTKRGIAHEYYLNPGSHSDAYWAKQLPDYLRWYTQAW